MSVRKEKRFVPEGFDLEEGLRDQLSGRSGTQRYLEGEAEALMIVHDLPAPRVPEREALVYWRGSDGAWKGPAGGEGLRELSAQLDRFQEKIDEYEAQIDETEEISEVFEMIRHAGPIARSMRNLAGVLEAAVNADGENRRLIGLRDRAREIQRAAELLYHDAKLTLDFWQAESAEDHQEAAERLNVIAYRLNLMAGFFLPLVAMGSLLGMNVHIPEFLLPWFWGILLAGMVFGVSVLFLVGWEGLRKRR